MDAGSIPAASTKKISYLRHFLLVVFYQGEGGHLIEADGKKNPRTAGFS